MKDNQLLRYSRQILLQAVDIPGQEKLLASRVLIIGMGGLGSPIALYLAAAGVGHLVITDHDDVDLTNLQRQIAHTTANIGQPKTNSAAEAIERINPEVKVTRFGFKLNDDQLAEQVAAADLVIDATDNFPTRIQVNHQCVKARTPLVWGAAVRFEGQVGVYHPDHPEAACYQCLYRGDHYPSEACAQLGVFTPVVGMIGTTQANEALKILLGIGNSLIGRVLLLDAMSMEWQSIQIKKHEGCPACSGADATA